MGICLGNNQDDFQLLTTSENISFFWGGGATLLTHSVGAFIY